MKFNEKDLSGLFAALKFAAEKHINQKRKNVEETPYINHPLEVARLLIDVGEVYDLNIIKGAILHDTIEDTETTEEELLEHFGKEVTNYVVEMSDDKSIPKAERKRLQVVNAPHKSPGAKQIKICDKTCNITDVTHNPPGRWDIQRRKDYLDWAQMVVEGLKGVNGKLEKLFYERLEEGQKILGIDISSAKKILEFKWDTYEDSIEEMFSIFSDTKFKELIKKIRNFYHSRGSISYSTEIERHEIILKIFTIATMYSEFCFLAADEKVEPDYCGWADNFDLSKSVIEEILIIRLEDDEEITAALNDESDEDIDDDEFSEVDIKQLVDTYRNEVYTELIELYGTVSGLFYSLWISIQSEKLTDLDDDGEQNGEQNMDEVLNFVSPEKMRAFEWVNEGMPGIM